MTDFSTINSEMHFRWIFPDGIDYWTPENPNARYQRPGSSRSGPTASLYAQRKFIRLQDISLSYNLSKEFIDRIGLNDAKLYVSGKNLLTITDWNGWDPETGTTIERDGRPVTKGITFGVDISF